MSLTPTIRIGIDVGGTFTDFAFYHPESARLTMLKLPSTPVNPAQAVLDGLAIILKKVDSIIPQTPIVDIVHGSTVATNALLERKGAESALITTAGFRDVLQIRRQNRPALYDLAADPPEPLIPEAQRLEVNERVDHTGSILEPLTQQDISRVIKEIQSVGIESVAICLLFSFLNDQHEQDLARAVRSAGLFASVSSEVLPEFREYERTSTTVVNAYVSPILAKYLKEITERLSPGNSLSPANFRVMQSNGGAIGIEEAGSFGVRCILSGPAGGVIGAQRLGNRFSRELPKDQESGTFSNLITFDMGGTSTDVSLILGSPSITTENTIAGYAIHIPMLDIKTIGAGGGSIARADRGGALRVGPESAGAIPGPACYGHGNTEQLKATVTDANLVLGRLLPEYFLGGRMDIYPQLADAAIQQLAQDLHMDPFQAALGVIEVVNAHMERALRVISVERGHDPQDFSLVSFGGAGGLHAAELARKLGIPQVIIPPTAAVFSAFGLLVADVIKDYSRTVMLPGLTPLDELDRMLSQLTDRGILEVQAEGVARERILTKKLLDMRYRGQSYELSIPFSEHFLAGFRQRHQEIYGYALPEGEDIEIVNLRVRTIGQIELPAIEPEELSGEDSSPALIDYRPVYFERGPVKIPCYFRDALQPGNRLTGPALIIFQDTVVLLTESDRAKVDAYRNILLTIGG